MSDERAPTSRSPRRNSPAKRLNQQPAALRGKLHWWEPGQQRDRRSTGNLSITNSQVTLLGSDCTKIEGSITERSANRFQLKLDGSDRPLLFQRSK